jgi:hypothetical protein
LTHSRVLKINQSSARIELIMRQRDDAGACIDYIASRQAEQISYVVTVEFKVTRFESGLAKRRLAWAMEMTQVSVEYPEVGRSAYAGAMTPDSTCELDQRSH